MHYQGAEIEEQTANCEESLKNINPVFFCWLSQAVLNFSFSECSDAQDKVCSY